MKEKINWRKQGPANPLLVATLVGMYIRSGMTQELFDEVSRSPVSWEEFWVAVDEAVAW